MTRKIVLFLMVGAFIGTLTGLAIADGTGDVPQSAKVDEQMSAEPGFSAIGGVADYWLEDQMSLEPRFAAVGGVADYWPEENASNIAQQRGPVETGALPEMSQDNDNDVPAAEPDSTRDQTGIDSP